MIIELFGKKWDVNSVTRKERRKLHRMNEEMILTKSKFTIKEAKNGEPPKVKIDKLDIDREVYGNLIEKTLSLAFDNPEILDETLNDVQQDALAQAILKNYLIIEKKKNGR